jgi:sugar phosphate isomerase/epimerase
MRVQRFLASAWASVHGPSDPRRLLLTLLDAKFAGLAVSPGPRPILCEALREAAADLPIAFAAVRVANPLAEHSATAGFAAAKVGERQVARAAIEQAVGMARTLGCAVVVFDPGVVPMPGEIEAEDLGDPKYRWTPERAQALQARRKAGRNAAVDRVCRELFDLIKSFPDIEFCLTAGRSVRAVLDPAAMRDICEDLGHRRPGYWHDAALTARRQAVLGEAQGEWLESFGNRCRGMSLGDANDDGLYLPPGSGGVDYSLLASYVRRTGALLPVVLELDLAVPPGELAGMRSFLDKYGF